MLKRYFFSKLLIIINVLLLLIICILFKDNWVYKNKIDLIIIKLYTVNKIFVEKNI